MFAIASFCWRLGVSGANSLETPRHPVPITKRGTKPRVSVGEKHYNYHRLDYHRFLENLNKTYKTSQKHETSEHRNSMKFTKSLWTNWGFSAKSTGGPDDRPLGFSRLPAAALSADPPAVGRLPGGRFTWDFGIFFQITPRNGLKQHGTCKKWHQKWGSRNCWKLKKCCCFSDASQSCTDVQRQSDARHFFVEPDFLAGPAFGIMSWSPWKWTWLGRGRDAALHAGMQLEFHGIPVAKVQKKQQPTMINRYQDWYLSH